MIVLPPTETVERVSKRPRTEGTKKLVVCIHHLIGDELDKGFYSFTFFSIQDLLADDTSLLVVPENTVSWPDKGMSIADSYSAPHNFEDTNLFMTFRHSSAVSMDGDGSGVIYAVGGLPANDFIKLTDDYVVPPSLPNAMTCIPLSGNTMLADSKMQLLGGKLYPLIEEINGLIYVLSGPAVCFSCPPHSLNPPPFEPLKDSFEVYNPRDGTRKGLDGVPFDKTRAFTYSPFIFHHEYRSLVFGNKLFVSDAIYSSVYDTTSNSWSACHLFPDNDASGMFSDPLVRKMFHQLDGCGPPFPFESKALLWKDQIFVCLMMTENIVPIGVFRITDDEKAVFLQLSFEGSVCPSGTQQQLVHLGGDHFALTLFRDIKVLDNSVTIFTFSLKIDATDPNLIIAKGLKEVHFAPGGVENYNLFPLAY